MFGKMNEALELLFKDDGVWKLDREMGSMEIPHVDRFFSYFDRKDKKERKFVKPEDVERMCACIREGLDGIRKIEDMIDELKWIRGSLVSHVLDMRNAYKPPRHAEHIETLRRMVDEKDADDEDAIRAVFAAILDMEKLPEQMVNLKAGWCHGCDSVYVRFGVSGKPTTATAIIPVVVDYSSEYKIPKDMDEQKEFPLAELEDRKPEILYVVTPGVYTEVCDYDTINRDNMETRCRDLDDLRGKIMNTLEYDVRESLKKVCDISEVKTVDDFRNWRFLRAANMASERNSTEVRKDE